MFFINIFRFVITYANTILYINRYWCFLDKGYGSRGAFWSILTLANLVKVALILAYIRMRKCATGPIEYSQILARITRRTCYPVTVNIGHRYCAQNMAITGPRNFWCEANIGQMKVKVGEGIDPYSTNIAMLLGKVHWVTRRSLPSQSHVRDTRLVEM